MTSFFSEQELSSLGLKSYGKNVLISKKASIYGASSIQIGNNVRIDDFCILSGRIELGRNIHIAAYSALFAGDAGIKLGDFCSISSRVCIYAVSDDYSGATMTNPTIPDVYKNVEQKAVDIGRHVIIGSGTTVLPGVTIADGTAVGAMSLIQTNTEAWRIYAGIPAKIIKDRSMKLLNLEEKYLNEN